MNHHQQIIQFSRHSAGLIRVAIKSDKPHNLMCCVTDRLSRLWDIGCHSDTVSDRDKETARRCTTALQRMFLTPNPCRTGFRFWD
jgi:hypothetical protein